MNVIWLLLIVLPNDGAGRQVGPFNTQQQCEAARSAYVGARINGAAVCVEARKQ